MSLGWNDLGDLSAVESVEALKDMIADVYPDEKKGSIPIMAGELRRFSHEIEIGDSVVTYNPTSRCYAVGEFAEPYRFDPSLAGHHHIRGVTWITDVPRDDLSVPTKNSLGSTIPLFLVPTEAADEIRRVMWEGGPSANDSAREGEELEALQEDFILKAREFIKDKIAELDWDDLQDLVATVLRSMGYRTRVVPPGPDRGRDIVASPDGLGLEDPRIIVQVKHRTSTTGSQELRSFIALLGDGDKGLYVSTGGFTKDAMYEAERASRPLTMIDLEYLIDLVLQNYDNFDAEGRAILPLKKTYWPL